MRSTDLVLSPRAYSCWSLPPPSPYFCVLPLSLHRYTLRVHTVLQTVASVLRTLICIFFP